MINPVLEDGGFLNRHQRELGGELCPLLGGDLSPLLSGDLCGAFLKGALSRRKKEKK